MGSNFEKEIWLTSEEACSLLVIKKDTLRKNCCKGNYTFETSKVHGLKEYSVLLSSLPFDVQRKHLGHEEKTENQIELNVEIYNKAPNWAKEKANKYLVILDKSNNLSGNELKGFIYQWNIENPEYKTSYCRVLEARRKYEEIGIAGLLAKYGNNENKNKIKKEWHQYFKSLYLKQGGPSASSCRMYTYGYALETENIEFEKFPLTASFLKKLKKEIPASSIYLARSGHAKWNRKYANYIERDYSAVACGSVWCGDHAQIDVMVMGANGKPMCPWVTSWRDVKSGKWLGWLLHEESGNSDHIFQSFYYGALEYGIPTDVLIDNGKDYRAKDFAGGRKVNENQARYMLGLLKVKPHFALPYNAQAKQIERDFLKIKEYFSKHSIGYRGGNVVERPEILKDEIKQNKICTFEEFKLIFDDFIKNVLNKMSSKGKVLKGKSPDHLWNEEFTVKRIVSKDALSLFCTRTSKVVSIGRNGVRDSELDITYWEEWMSARKGEKVYIRRDIKAYQEAWVFKADTDEYLGRASIAELMPFFAETDIEKAELKQATAIKRKDQKIAKSFLQVDSYSLNDKVSHIKNTAKKLSESIEEKNPQILEIADTFMDRVVAEDKKQQNTDKFEVSRFYKNQKPAKKKIYHLRCEKEEAEEEEKLCKRSMNN